ncbi:MAG: magnesium-translocating P-type ATPase [Acidimicrobiales bacterium]
MPTTPDLVSGAEPFWSLELDPAGPLGLTVAEAERRAAELGTSLHVHRRMPGWRLAVRQVENPIVLLLIGATALSMSLGDVVDGVIILAITLASGVLGFAQERGAVRAVEDLLRSVRVHADVMRDGVEHEVALDDVVPGDLLVVRAGDVIAGDARVVSSDCLLLDEAALTGESFPVEKRPEPVAAYAPLASRSSALWCGTHVMSGTGTAVVVAVGADTEFGKVGERLARAHVPTAFEVGLRRFGYLLMRTTALLVVGVFVVNVVLDRPIVESLLFSLALAVGLTPQLLPTIVTVTLAAGARRMAERQVIVKRLDAIEDIGAIDVLCTDKTGTLTSGDVQFARALDPDGTESSYVRDLARVNATAQRGFANPIDRALAAGAEPAWAVRVLDELPYDFERRLLSVLVEIDGRRIVITKGAFDATVGVCDLDPERRDALRERFASLSAEGLRVLGLALAERPDTNSLTADEEHGLAFAGFVCFTDPPKPDAAEALRTLADLGVRTKVITGDNRFAAARVAAAVGLDATAVATGGEIATFDDDALTALTARTDVFAEIDPLHKERIVEALRRGGHVVGYLGDGINDAPSLRTADVGISVDTAVDVAKHAADVVLLDKDLAVIADGIRQGRRVFANTTKYVQVTVSANFGNMLSMAVAAAALPFLPLLPRQILLLNFLSDIPGTTIAADRVDPEAIDAPHGWDTRRLRDFMVVFGLISSVFDITTFVVLRAGFGADATLFHTGWFIESTATELAVMLVLRTARPAWHSRPGAALALSSAAVAVITVALPFTPLADDLGLVGPHVGVLAALAAVTVAYVACTEIGKRTLLARLARRHRARVP